MIRGIILLILSCVVLNTVATDKQLCSCDSYTTPIYEQSHTYFPTPTTKDVKYVRPNDCSDLHEIYDEVSVPNHGFLKTHDTNLISSLIGIVEGLLKTVLSIIEHLLGLLLGHQKECGLINDIIHWLFHDVLHILDTCDHPLCGVKYVENLMEVHTKKRQMQHMNEYLEKSLSAAESRAEVIKAEKDIYGKYMTVSRDLDAKERKCKSGSGGAGGLVGGLLGGVLGGGVLGGGSCNRESLLNNLLGTLLNLVGGVLSLVGQILKTVVALIDDCGLGLGLIDRNLLSLPLSLFEQISPMDYHEEHVRKDCLHPIMRRYQNNDPLSFEEVYTNYANIMRDPAAKSHYMELPGLPFEDYEYSGHQMTCKNHLGNDITVDLGVNLLNILKVKLGVKVGITCILGLKVNLKVGVNLGNGLSLHDGATKYMKSMGVVTKGMTGCQHVHYGIDHIDQITGLVKVKLELDALKHGLLCGLLNGLLGGLDLDLGLNILALDRAHGYTHQVISECDSYKDIPSITEAITETETYIAECKGRATEKKERVETLLKEIEETEEPEIEETEEEETEVEEEETEEEETEEEETEEEEPVVVVDKAKKCVSTVQYQTQKSQTQYMAALEHYRQAMEHAEMETAICKKELLDIAYRRQMNPHDQHLIEIQAGLKIRLEKILNDCQILKGLCLELEAKINVKVDLGILALKACVDLKLKLEALIAGHINLIAQLKIALKLDLDAVLGGLTGFLTCSRGHSLLGLKVDVDLNLEAAVGFLFNFHDTCHEGESEEYMRQQHKKYIQSAVAGYCQNPNVYVEEVGYKKRSETDKTSFEYKVTVTDGPATTTKTVAFANQETGMSAETAATSSASSLVFSFFVLFVSFLCFF